VRSVRRWDRCDSAIGVTGWLGLAGHELGERESEQREKKRAEKRPVWLGVARDSEKENRQ
jgi:hypothetical protein